MRRRLLALPFVVVGLGAVLPGCDLLAGLGCDFENDETCEDPTRAQIVGHITVPDAAGEAVSSRGMPLDLKKARDLVAAAAIAQRAEQPKKYDIGDRHRVPVKGHGNDFVVRKIVEEKFRPGEVIVRAHEPIRGRKAEISRALSIYLQDKVDVNVRLCGTEFRCLADLTWSDGKPVDLADTAEIVAKLAQMPLLKYAERNLILEKMSVFPDDEFFTFQWHYNAIDVPAAWDITQGDPGIVGAVIDTGILFDHPDLADRVIGGADLIDDPTTANDGDGRDNDGDDAGDNSCGNGCHSHHGSHVAGTMGASTDNGTMVSGITWFGGLLAVRTLGVGGGSLADIADGIEWAVGNSVDGVADNQTPADVLNMSLGGQGESEAMNEAIADAVATGAIVAVAAGNDDQDASAFTPANAPEAIVVSSVGNGANQDRPVKASYSNFGNLVDVAAPGGEQAVDNDNDGNGDGVLSTIGDFVAFYQGTSMATPHVAGVAMLMKSVNPALDNDGARQILQDTSDADIECDEGCGSGLINAFGAVSAAAGDLDGLSAAGVRVGKGVTSAAITFRNFSDAAVDVDFEVGGENRDAVSVDPTSGSIPAGGKIVVTANITRADGNADVGSATVSAVTADEAAEARLDWTADQGAVVQIVSVGALPILEDGTFDPPVRIVETNAVKNFDYKIFNVDAGEYLVIGLLDGNNDGDFDDDEDGTGFFVAPAEEGQVCTSLGCGHLEVAAGETFSGADFLVAPGFTGGDDTGGNGDGVLGDACADSSECGDGLYCETFDGGYCTTDCNGGADECPTGSTCFDIGDGEPYQICFKDCAADGDCGRAGYVCDVFDGVGSCIPEN